MTYIHFVHVAHSLIKLHPPQHKHFITILLTKTTAARNEDALTYLRVRGLYFLAVVFAATVCILRGIAHTFTLYCHFFFNSIFYNE